LVVFNKLDPRDYAGNLLAWLPWKLECRGRVLEENYNLQAQSTADNAELDNNRDDDDQASVEMQEQSSERITSMPKQQSEPEQPEQLDQQQTSLSDPLWIYTALSQAPKKSEHRRQLLRDFYVFSACRTRSTASSAVHSVQIYGADVPYSPSPLATSPSKSSNSPSILMASTTTTTTTPSPSPSSSIKPQTSWVFTSRSESRVTIVACFDLINAINTDGTQVLEHNRRHHDDCRHWESLIHERVSMCSANSTGAVRALLTLLASGCSTLQETHASVARLINNYRGGFSITDSAGGLASVYSADAPISIEWFGAIANPLSSTPTKVLGDRFVLRTLTRTTIDATQTAYVIMGTPLFWQYAERSSDPLSSDSNATLLVPKVTQLDHLKSAIHTRIAKLEHGGDIVLDSAAGPMTLEQLTAEIDIDLAQQEPFDTLISTCEQWIHEQKLLPSFMFAQPTKRDLALVVMYLLPRDRPEAAVARDDSRQWDDLCSLMDQELPK
jgi:hypothetical protein